MGNGAGGNTDLAAQQWRSPYAGVVLLGMAVAAFEMHCAGGIVQISSTPGENDPQHDEIAVRIEPPTHANKKALLLQ